MKDIRYLISTDCNDDTLQSRIENYITDEKYIDFLESKNIGFGMKITDELIKEAIDFLEDEIVEERATEHGYTIYDTSLDGEKGIKEIAIAMIKYHYHCSDSDATKIEKFTAEQANDLAVQIDYGKEFLEVISHIKDSARGGVFYVIIYKSLKSQTVIELEKLGYNVKRHGDIEISKDKTYYTISWR